MGQIRRLLTAVFARYLKPGSPHQNQRLEMTEEEWIHSMLRKSRAFPLAVLCFISVAALEILNRKVQNSNGIPERNNHTVFLLRYLPTAIVVGFGFLWKSIIADIKTITPWSTISGTKWTPAADSILLNYVNNIEIYSLFMAARKRHWAMFFGIFAGFLCGVAVAAANSLTYVDLFAATSMPTKLQRTSRFQFNGTLVDTSGKLAVPLDKRLGQPYAAVALERLPGGKSVPWTNQGFAFESFSRIPPSPDSANTSIKATVSALSVKVECHQLRYDVTPVHGDEGTMSKLKANAQDLSKAGCLYPVVILANNMNNGTQAWLNLTRCSSDPEDIRILASVTHPQSSNNSQCGSGNAACHPSSDLTAAGLLCLPTFAMQAALVSADESTGEILGYDLEPGTQETDVHSSIESLLLLLLNPTDSLTGWASEDTINYETLTQAIESHKMDLRHIDGFFSTLLGKDQLIGKAYVKNPDVFQSDTEALASTTLAHVFHTFARVNDTESIDGTVITIEAKVFIRQLSLRILQAIITSVGVVVIQQATLLRPKTGLKENPGSLAAMALLLAVSKPHTEQMFWDRSITDERLMLRAFSSTRCRISSHQNGPVRLELDTVLERISTHQPKIQKHCGWRPFAFRAGIKAGILLAMLAVITTLAVLQKVSKAHNGLNQDGSIASALYQYIPSVILLLLSYICTGIDGAVRSASSYNILQNGHINKCPLLFNIRDRPSIRAPWSVKQAGFAITASSFALLLFPFIKVFTASLYPTTLVTANKTLDLTIDQSLVMDLQSVYDTTGQIGTLESAAHFADWSKTPAFGISQRDGELENFVFANISESPTIMDYMVSLGDEIDIRVPAIQVDLTCQPLGYDHFEISAHRSEIFGCWNLTVQCSTTRCSDVFGPGNLSLGNLACESRVKIDMFNYQGYSMFGGGAYGIVLADFSGMTGPVANNTVIPAGNLVTVNPGTFNVTMPTIRAVSCNLNLNQVEVNTTFTRNATYGLNGAAALLPWRPSKFDRSSITKQRNYSQAPFWFFQVSQILSFYDHGELSGNSLWPVYGSSFNVFQLLATYAEYKIHNLTSLLDPDELSGAAEQMITAFTTELLTSLRPLFMHIATTSSAQNSTSSASQTRQGTLIKHHPRIYQDLHSTIIIEALLIAVLCCLITIFIRFPRPAILPKAPDTIAARLSLLAGSRLVQRLREESAVSVREEDPIWRERASLGWWKVQTATGEKWRWGIDIGDDVVRRSWDDPPS